MTSTDRPVNSLKRIVTDCASSWRPLVVSLSLTALGYCLLTDRVRAQDVPSPLSGYRSYADMEAALRQLDASPWAKLSSLGETRGERNIWLLTVAAEGAPARPAILVVGNVTGSHVLGRELALRMAQKIVQQAESEPEVADWLSRFTLYFIPSPTPDATEKNFRFPVRESNGNLTPTDDDRDFEFGEDPPTDLNQDGWISMMRIAVEFGGYRTHPSDPRVLIPVDEKKREMGQYRLLPESLDSDQDESFGEDGSDGVDFNRNFPFNYSYFAKSTGPHQVSESESRAVADFMFDHPEIAFVFCFSPEDNLFHPWKGSEQSDGAKIKSKVLTDDQPFFECLAESYQNLHAGHEAPASNSGEGSFSEWSYFHFGRWTFSARGWWIPQVKQQPVKDDAKETDEKPTEEAPENQEKPATPPDAAPGDEPAPAASESPSAVTPPEVTSSEVAPAEVTPAEVTPSEVTPSEVTPSEVTPSEVAPSEVAPSEIAPPVASGKVDSCAQPNQEKLGKDDKRGAELLNALAWFAEQDLIGFVDWQSFEHPGFPGKTVEIGGFKPLMLLNPPESLIQPLVKPHVDFLKVLTDSWPSIAIRDVEAKRLGPGLYDIRCRVVNTGSLPTMPQMGRINEQWYPIQVQLQGADGARWIHGSLKQSVGRLKELGGSEELHWVFLLTGKPDSNDASEDKRTGLQFTIEACAPTLHPVQVQVEVSEGQE